MSRMQIFQEVHFARMIMLLRAHGLSIPFAEGHKYHQG